MTYEPAEDSELLAAVLETLAEGSVLDVGTGSGILARLAHEKGHDVTAVDIDKEVVKSLQSEPFRVVLSDGFSAISRKFDTIVCNPPYLPDDKMRDIALHGGPHGYEYIVRIISQAKFHLTSNGQFIFLISTLTKPKKVEEALKFHGYSWEIVARKKLFMEELLVYRAQLLLGEPATFVGKGTRSVVYASQGFAAKISSTIRAQKEAAMLQAVNKRGIGPKFISLNDNVVRMEYVVGERFDKYVRRTSDSKVIRELLRQARILDEIGINKQEGTRPGKNILVTSKGRVVLLDFERALYSLKPRNITQFATWISRYLHKDCAYELHNYRRNPSEENYRAVCNALGL